MTKSREISGPIVSRGVLLGALALVVPLIVFSAPAAFASGGSQPRPVEFHVAPDGNDTNPGTARRPFASLHRARRAVRSSTAGMAANVVVNLHAGTHTLRAPLRLSDDAGDSGENGFRVIYQGYSHQATRLERILARSQQRRQQVRRQLNRALKRLKRVGGAGRPAQGARKQVHRARTGLRRVRQRVRENRDILRSAHRATRDNVTISGGVEVTGWTLDDPGGDVWSADVGDLETRQLYVDDVRATRARFDAGARGGIPGEVTDTEEGYVTDSVEPQAWERPEDIEFVYHPPSVWHHFSEPRCGVADISGDAESTTITMDQPCYRWFRQNHQGEWEGFTNFYPGPPTHIENSRSFLTEPGTFYLDRSRAGDHVLYYIPRAGEHLGTAKVIAPQLEQLIDGRGMPGAPLRDITFRGVTFADATWMGPSESTGFSQVFGPLYEGGDTPHFDDPWDMSEDALLVPGNVRFHGSQRIGLVNNRFARLGGDAIEIGLRSSGNVIRGNIVTDVSGGGVSIGSRHPGTDRDRINRANTVENNWVHQVGVEYQGSAGIYAEKTQHARIAHNQVNDVAYTGLVFGEFWTHYPEGLTTAHGNRILNNHIFRVNQKQLDGGGIWTAAHQGTSFADGTVVAGNVVHDTAPPDDLYHPDPTPDWGGLGLFPDDDSSFIVWRDNVVYRAGRAALGGCQPLGRLVFRENFWDDDEPAWDCFGPVDGVVLEDNTLLEGDPEQACAAMPDCAAIVNAAGLEPAYRDLLGPP